MSDVPIQVIVAAFKDEKTAKEALKNLQQAQKEKLIKIENAAILTKDEKGKLHIRETADVGGKKGAAIGGVAGAAIGLIAGPALLVPAAVGALVGGLTAKARDSGFSDARLEALGQGLKPGSSAIVAVVEHTYQARIQEEVRKMGADLLTASISADISQQLDAGHDVAYTAIFSQQGIEAARGAGSGDEMEGEHILVDDTGTHASRFVATKDGITVVDMDVPDEEG